MGHIKAQIVKPTSEHNLKTSQSNERELRKLNAQTQKQNKKQAYIKKIRNKIIKQ